MKFSVSTISAPVVFSIKVPRDPRRHQGYESGEVMEAMMARKAAVWSNAAQTGLVNPRKLKSTNRFTACKDGHVTLSIDGTGNQYQFQCDSLDVIGHRTHEGMGTTVTAVLLLSPFHSQLRDRH